MPKTVQSCRTSSTSQKCRACGCTQNNCSGCVARTGHPCYWVESDLCSACAPIKDKSQHLSVHVFASQLRSKLTNREMESLFALDGSGDSQDYVIRQWLRLRRQFGGPLQTTPCGRYLLGSGTSFTYQDEIVAGVLGDMLAQARFHQAGGEA